MRLIVSPDEFKKIRRIVGNTKNGDIITNFNKIFDSQSSIPVKGVRLPKSGDVVIEIPEHDAMLILKVLESNAGTFGEMLRTDLTITSVPKWLNFVKNLIGAIGNLF
jgi:hypothetical protein